jgi:hypothetical protein
LPSWMPELSSTLASAPYHNGQYTAGTGQPAEFQMSEDLNQLSLRGLYLDTIVFTSDGDILEPIELTKVSFQSLNIIDAWDFAVKAQRRIADMCSLFELRLPEIQQRYKDSNPREVFWQTITDNFRDKGVPKQDELAQILGNLEEFVSSVIEQPSTDETRSVKDFFAIFSPANGNRDWSENASMYKAMELLAPAICQNIFAVTEIGFMALAPPGTKPGDVIAIFQGSPVPHILRPNPENKTFSLWGEVYVHGVMHGKAMDGEKTWFVLE